MSSIIIIIIIKDNSYANTLIIFMIIGRLLSND